MKNISTKEFDALVDKHGEDLMIKEFPGYNTRYYVLLDTENGFRNLGPVRSSALKNYPTYRYRGTQNAIIHKLELCPA